MSFDVVLLIVLIVAGVCFFRRVDSSVYFIASLDIFFRILTFIKNNLGVGEISSFISKYFPESIPSIIYKYTIKDTDDLVKNKQVGVYYEWQ